MPRQRYGQRRISYLLDSTKINRFLMKRGMPNLQDPNLVKMIAYVCSEVRFAQALAACVPEKRTAMYESMRPYLRFTAQPLDVYMARAKEMAAQKEQARERNTVEAIIEREAGKKSLTLTCGKCLAEETFYAVNTSHEARADAVMAARKKGWVLQQKRSDEGILEGQMEVCPKCPAFRPKAS